MRTSCLSRGQGGKAKGVWVELCCKALPGTSWALPVWCNLCPIPLFLSLGPARQSQCPVFFFLAPPLLCRLLAVPRSQMAGLFVFSPPHSTQLPFLSTPNVPSPIRDRIDKGVFLGLLPLLTTHSVTMKVLLSKKGGAGSLCCCHGCYKDTGLGCKQ